MPGTGSKVDLSPFYSASVKRRKANFSIDEVRILIDGYKEHRAALEGIVSLGGPRHHVTEIWSEIHERYKEQFPESERTIWDLRKKVNKLKMVAKKMFTKERLKAQGKDVSNFPSLPNLSRADELVLSVLKEDLPMDDVESDSEYVEYEMEFDEGRVNDEEGEKEDEEEEEEDSLLDSMLAGGQRSLQIKRKRTTEDDDDNDDEEDNEDYDLTSLNPEQIMKNMLFPERKKKTPPQLPPQMLPPQQAGRGGKRRQPRRAAQQRAIQRAIYRKRQAENSSDDKIKWKMEARAQEILDLRKAKLVIERDNLLLVQRKLRIEVKLAEKQLSGGGEGGSSRCGRCGKSCSHCEKAGDNNIDETHHDQGQSDGNVSNEGQAEEEGDGNIGTGTQDSVSDEMAAQANEDGTSEDVAGPSE